MDKNIFYKLLGKEEPGLLERNKELITDLEDVTAKTKETTTADEIEIGDLV